LVVNKLRANADFFGRRRGKEGTDGGDDGAVQSADLREGGREGGRMEGGEGEEEGK
jgi:hypothetical protein